MKKRLEVRKLSFGNKAARLLWNAIWIVLYRPSPTPLFFWRRFLLRLFGAKMGRGARVYPSTRVWAPWNLEMNKLSCLGNWVDCYSVDKITIGAHSTVSQYSYLCSAGHDVTDASMPLVTAPIVIGERVWITADVFVGPGVTIGDGAVIAARSSVFTDIAAWVVAKGNPAVAVRPRIISTAPIGDNA